MAISFSQSKKFENNQQWFTQQLPEQARLITGNPKSKNNWFFTQQQLLIEELKQSIKETYQLVPKESFHPQEASLLLGKISANNSSRRTLSEKLQALEDQAIPRIQRIYALNLDLPFQKQPNSPQVEEITQLIANLSLDHPSPSKRSESLTEEETKIRGQLELLPKALKWVAAPLTCIEKHLASFPQGTQVSLPGDTQKLMQLTVQGVSIQESKALNEGSHGAVAEVRFGNNAYAQKTPGSDRTAQKCFENEQCVYMAIPPHPNLVSLKGVSSQGLLLEKVSGGNLEDKFNSEPPLTIQDLLGYFLNIAEALLHIHNHGYTHKDVKPPNILIDYSSNTAQLCDLGLTVATMDDGRTAGTYSYLAPEIYVKKKPFSAKVDSWSFGVMMYTLLTGITLFETHPHEDVPKCYNKPCAESMVLDLNTNKVNHTKQLQGNKALFLKVKNLIKGCLHGDPEQRLSMEQIRDTLAECKYLCPK